MLPSDFTQLALRKYVWWMVFSSLIFIFWFIPIFFGIYYTVPARFKNIVLFMGSIVFYGWGEPKYLLLIFVSIIVNYVFGRIMGVCERSSHRRAVLVSALVFDFGMLIVFKYTGFLVQNINGIFAAGISVPNILLPLGISFYTFQIASYIIDLYRGEIEAEKNILCLGTYLVMFPQLIAGPIVVYRQVIASLHARNINAEDISSGILTFIWGLASKVLIANRCGQMWDDITRIGYANISMPLAWLGAVSFTFQIYFDFNGYSLMAIGLGRMLGFDFPKNFDYPYISRSVTEFWRRWHITLGTWFREYVYIPLGGNRKGAFRTYVNLFAVWILTGLWHGAGWNFVIWGLFFFVILCAEKSFLLKYLENHAVISRIYTCFIVCLSWVIFAITDFGLLKQYFGALVSFKAADDFLYYFRNYAVILVIAGLFSTPLPERMFGRVKSKWVKTAVGMALLVISVCYLVDATYNPFLYFRF